MEKDWALKNKILILCVLMLFSCVWTRISRVHVYFDYTPFSAVSVKMPVGWRLQMLVRNGNPWYEAHIAYLSTFVRYKCRATVRGCCRPKPQTPGMLRGPSGGKHTVSRQRNSSPLEKTIKENGDSTRCLLECRRCTRANMATRRTIKWFATQHITISVRRSDEITFEGIVEIAISENPYDSET